MNTALHIFYGFGIGGGAAFGILRIRDVVEEIIWRRRWDKERADELRKRINALQF